MSLEYTTQSLQKMLERRALRVLLAHQEVMVLKVKVVHCLVFDSYDAVCVDDDVVVVKEVEQADNVIKLVV